MSATGAAEGRGAGGVAADPRPGAAAARLGNMRLPAGRVGWYGSGGAATGRFAAGPVGGATMAWFAGRLPTGSRGG